MPLQRLLLLLLLQLLLLLAAIPKTAAASNTKYQLPLNFFDRKCDPCIAREESVIQVLIAKSVNSNNDEYEWARVQSAMEQASRDTAIQLEFSYYTYQDNSYNDVEESDINNDNASSKDIRQMAVDIRQLILYHENHAFGDGGNAKKLPQELEYYENHDYYKQADALIVALPSPSTLASSKFHHTLVEDALAEALAAGMPVFGFGGTHYQHLKAHSLGLLGFVGQDEFLAGQQVASEVLMELEELQNITTVDKTLTTKNGTAGNNTTIATVPEEDNVSTSQKKKLKALFVTHASTLQQQRDRKTTFQQRFLGLQSVLREQYYFVQSDAWNITATNPTMIDFMELELDAATLSLEEKEEPTRSTNSNNLLNDTTLASNNNNNEEKELDWQVLQLTSPEEILQNCHKYDIVIVDHYDDNNVTQALVDLLQNVKDYPNNYTFLNNNCAQLDNNNNSINTLLATTTSDNEEATSLISLPVVATFGISPVIRQSMLAGIVQFAAAPQPYLQSVFVVLMASVFVTTGKKLALPTSSHGSSTTDDITKMYLSGPQIVRPNKRNKLPEDSMVNCEDYAFPICSPDAEFYEENPNAGEGAAAAADDDDSTAATAYESPIMALAPPLSAGGSRICNAQGCVRRGKLRFAGVLHGTTTSLFWKPIFAGAHQAARDLGVSLEMKPFEPQLDRDVHYARMAALIRNYCEQGIDGIIVTIPSDALLESLQLCQQLNVPVISINSGAEFAEQLGLMIHIGQMEYNAGYEAGKRLVEEGMKEGYCVIHNMGNTALIDRCRGFEDAIATYGGSVKYQGMVEVSGDDVAKYVLAVETAVAENSGIRGDTAPWDGIGLISLSISNIDSALAVLNKHPNVILGTFDVREQLFEPLAAGKVKFGIDQQALLQGIMPVYLLTYAAYSKQAIANKVVETGPQLVDIPPSTDQQICDLNHFPVCAEIPHEDMLMLPTAVVAVGICMAALTLAMAIASIAWTIYYWSKSELVRVSQPPFLILLTAGNIISTLSIFFMSVETEYQTLKSPYTGLLTNTTNPDISRVNASCMAVPWLYSIGGVIVFTSLFSRIWKVKMVYRAGERFRRVTVTWKDVLPYAMLLLSVVLGLLIAWQVADPFVWVREVTLEDRDGLALESAGQCTSDNGWHFWMALLAFQILYLVYALVLCWQTKDIPTDFSESNYVSLCVFCIFQVVVLVIPITAMVREDPTAYYFVRACAVFLENFSVLCLIFLPKMWRVHTGNDRLTVVRKSSHMSFRMSGGSQDLVSSDPFDTSAPMKRSVRFSNSNISVPNSVGEGVSTLSLAKESESAPSVEVKSNNGVSTVDAITNKRDSEVQCLQQEVERLLKVNEDLNSRINQLELNKPSPDDEEAAPVADVDKTSQETAPLSNK